MENIFNSFGISGQGMSLQRLRLSAIAKNIANVNSTNNEVGQPYQREIVVAHAINDTPFEQEFKSQIRLNNPLDGHTINGGDFQTRQERSSVLSAKIERDQSPSRLVYEPGHPDASEEGYVAMPNVNIVTEMVDMISAQRAFEANTAVFGAAKNFAKDALEI